MDFILATTNPGKVLEIKDLIGEGHSVKTLADVGFYEEIIEDGKTFLDNAVIKAKAAHNAINAKYDYILADDSGIIIDALDSRPGADSKGWLGENISEEEINVKVIEMLAGVSGDKRSAGMTTVIACIDPKGRIQTTEGSLEGLIALKPEGESGFGYDHIFYVPTLKATLAQITREEKNSLSHRMFALRRMFELLGV